MKVGDGARDVAFVESIVGGAYAVDPPAVRLGRLLVGHVLQGRGEVLLHEALAGARRTTFGQVDGGVARPAPRVMRTT